MNSRLFPIPPPHVSLVLLFLILVSILRSFAYDDWFYNCTHKLDCRNIGPLGIPLWRNDKPESCGNRQPIMRHCEGSDTIMEIWGAGYELLGFSEINQILIIAENGFANRSCSSESDHDNLASPIYGIIPLSYKCGHSQIRDTPDKFTCPGTKFGYDHMQFEAKTPNGYCILSAVIPIPSYLLADGLQIVERHIRAHFDEGAKVDAEVCRNCTISNGICGYIWDWNQTICYCQSRSNGFEPCPSLPIPGAPAPSSGYGAHSKKFTRWMKIGIATFGVLVMMISIALFVYYKRKISIRKQVEEMIKEYGNQTPKRYGYSEVKKMTRSFKHKLGQGGYGIVYKGKLRNGLDVAVKLLNKSKGDGKEFINEVANISTTSHVNIVTLLGFCYEMDKRALIYEYMPRGSLDKYIHQGGSFSNEHQLDWKALFNIVIGIARGLDYLHRGCNTRILHFDIKPHNILLDEDFCPKISDFGLAKKCNRKESYVSMTGTRGTPGFIAPEVFSKSFGKASHKSDVYSFGMLILEMVGQRKNHHHEVVKSSEEYFPDWIYENLKQSNNSYWVSMIEEEEELARKMIIVSLYCTQMIPSERPSMSEVIEMLGKSLDGLQIPPKPSLPSPQRLSQNSLSVS